MINDAIAIYVDLLRTSKKSTKHFLETLACDIGKKAEELSTASRLLLQDLHKKWFCGRSRYAVDCGTVCNTNLIL